MRRRLTGFSILYTAMLTLAGCAFWDPFDHDDYRGRADAVIEIDGNEYRTSWSVPIKRISSFNPYSATGHQDCWRFTWGGGSIALRDGTIFWVDASNPVSKTDEARLLGITGAQPSPRPPRSPDTLTPNHPLIVEVPIYPSSTSDRPTPIGSYSGPCGKNDKCKATVKFTVPDDYVGPYDRNPENVMEWLPGVCG